MRNAVLTSLDCCDDMVIGVWTQRGRWSTLLSKLRIGAAGIFNDRVDHLHRTVQSKTWGGIVCNGKPTCLWSGITPNGQSGIVLATTESSRDVENYLIFVVFASKPTVSLLVTTANDKVDASLSLIEGWPIVKLSSKNGDVSEQFGFPGSQPSMPYKSEEELRPWKVERRYKDAN